MDLMGHEFELEKVEVTLFHGIWNLTYRTWRLGSIIIW
jgi:hypothetical protein